MGIRPGIFAGFHHLQIAGDILRRVGMAQPELIELGQELGPAAGFIFGVIRGGGILLQSLGILRQHLLNKMRRLMGGGAGNGGGDMTGAAGAGIPHMNGHIHKLAQW